MKTATKGNEAEAMILASLIERGFDVSVPFGGGQPYDLMLDLGGWEVLKVQCKTGWQAKGCITFNTRSTDHGQGRRPYFGLAHIFAVYFPLTRSVYLVPLDAVGGFRGWLRLEPPRNNQQKGIRFAADFGIDQWPIVRLLEAKREAEVTAEPELNFA
ncbi:MAG TPA: group I intron-associated PD-(D/E)XK endonuclease [Solirubrobacterales bacterium]|nr:group I intron-associated PD-(D/E)XK endonuclease [Solirubrobacterales bacterium]